MISQITENGQIAENHEPYNMSQAQKKFWQNRPPVPVKC
jgi:hypothetical protein